MKKFLLAILILLGGLWATQAQAFVISPLKYLVTLDPGTTQNILVDIKNNEDNNITVKPVVLGVIQSDRGKIEYLSGVSRAESWVEADVDSLVIEKNETKQINFTITAPSNASPGSYYLVVGGQEAGGGGQIGISGRLFTLLTVQISGIAQEKLTVNKWQAEKFFVVKKAWPFRLEIKNSGNIEVPYRVSAIVRDWLGEEKASYDLTNNENILSGNMFSGRYTIDVDGKNFWPGLYQVQSRVKYGLTDQVATAMVYIIYFPVWSWVVLGVIILVIVGAFTSQYKFQMGRDY